mmetsp:Transcript_26147/g.60107  ORF Transcript_26147/g.60107 Transcript_26147/m.60107 type:complete len:177 (+) Transcript_26147:131-661(+)
MLGKDYLNFRRRSFFAFFSVTVFSMIGSYSHDIFPLIFVSATDIEHPFFPASARDQLDHSWELDQSNRINHFNGFDDRESVVQLPTRRKKSKKGGKKSLPKKLRSTKSPKKGEFFEGAFKAPKMPDPFKDAFKGPKMPKHLMKGPAEMFENAFCCGACHHCIHELNPCHHHRCNIQ